MSDPSPQRVAPTEVAVRPWRELDEAELTEWQELQAAVHGPPEQRRQRARLVWAPLELDSSGLVSVHADDQLVSGLVLITRTVDVGGTAILAGGIRGVVTHPTQRRRGFARAAMLRATAFAWECLNLLVMVLLSSAMAVRLYRALGWREVAGPVRCQQPSGELVFGDVHPEAPAMMLVRDGATWPVGPLDLGGLPL